MTLTTPLRNYPYPQYTDAANFPAQQQAFALAVDSDINTSLQQPITAALDAPSARASRPVGTQAIANATTVTLSYTVEDYDNAGFVNLGTSTTNFTINTAGVYLLTGSVNFIPDGSATGAAVLIIQSSTVALPFVVGTSRNLDNDKDTSLSCTTLHRVTTTPETINLIVRHNHGASLNVSIAQLTVTRIA